MSVHTCPKCELRFERESEVVDHLVRDHDADPDAVRRHPVPPPKQARPSVVVVGNHTLLGDRLRDRVREVTTGGAEVHVVVPIGSDDELDIGFWRGRALAERIVAPGVDVTVDAGVGDPVVLVERSLQHRHPDRVILSTFPAGLSRWLESDTAGRMRSAFGIPVEVVVAEG